MSSSASERRYCPRRAWRFAGVYFAACLLIAAASGALAEVLGSPLASAGQLRDPRWWALLGAAVAVVVVGYGWFWPRGTFTDGRVRHGALSLAFGAVWGCCQGLLFLSLWLLVARSGLSPPWVAVICFVLLSNYIALWHSQFWDIWVSPPHNYREWNLRKVLGCHVPNLILCLTLMAWSGSAAIWVLLQGLALALSARAMHFPAWFDDYSAVAGEQRTAPG